MNRYQTQRLNPSVTVKMSDDRLQIENKELRQRLEIAEQTLREMRSVLPALQRRDETHGLEVDWLGEGNHSYREIFERFPLGVATLNASGDIVYSNSRFSEMLGHTRSRLTGMNFRCALPEGEWAMYESLLAQSRSGAVQSQTHLVHSDGSPLPVLLTFHPFSSTSEVAIGVCITDLVTQEHKDQFNSVAKTLRTNEERYRTLFNSIDEGFCVVEIIFDQTNQAVDYRFVEVNAIFEKQTGLRDATGKYMREMVPDLEDKWLDRYCDVSLTGNSIRFTDEAKPMGRWFDVFAFRLGDPTQRRVAILFTDITLQRQADEELKQARSRLESTLAAAEIGTWEYDAMSNIVHADRNLQRMFGFTAQQAEGVPIEDYFAIIHPDDRGRVMHQITDALHQGEAFECDYRLLAGDAIRYVVARGRVERDSSGQPIRLPCVVVNITDRRLTEQKLEQVAANLCEADRRKDEFLATLSHELRNPLSPIKIAVQLMQMATDDPVQLRELSGLIDRQVNQMVRLIDDLMDVSRISRGKLTLQTRTCDLREVVANALEAAEPFINASGQTLHLIEPSHAMLVNGDPVRLTQVLVNLLNNAAKYTPAAGEIWLTLKQDAGDAILSVRDNGAGLLESQLVQIFEMFEQIDVSKERGQAGLGIGLSLVKTLVELHRGTVTATSEGPGHGCDFQVRLPLSPDQQAVIDTTDDLLCDNAASRAFRVLVVEDTSAIRYMLVRLLVMMGHEVAEAANGKEGLEKAITFQPDVILSDISMPEMNGHELATSIRSNDALKHIIMVALTGFGQNADRENALRCGFDDYMTKPADARLLSKLFKRLALTSIGRCSSSQST